MAQRSGVWVARSAGRVVLGCAGAWVAIGWQRHRVANLSRSARVKSPTLAAGMPPSGFQVGCSRRYDDGSPASSPSSTSATMRPPTAEQVALLLDAAERVPSPWLGAWTVLAAATGARNGELCGLEWC